MGQPWNLWTSCTTKKKKKKSYSHSFRITCNKRAASLPESGESLVALYQHQQSTSTKPSTPTATTTWQNRNGHSRRRSHDLAQNLLLFFFSFRHGSTDWEIFCRQGSKTIFAGVDDASSTDPVKLCLPSVFDDSSWVWASPTQQWWKIGWMGYTWWKIPEGKKPCSS